MADLGGTAAGIFAATLSSAIAGFIAERGEHYTFHFPHVEDWTGPDDPETTLVTIWGIGTDGDPSNDFSGHEELVPTVETLDQCLEPLYVFEHARIEEGQVTGENGMLPVVTLAPGRGARVFGEITPGGRSISGEVCAYFTIRELGQGAGYPTAPGLSSLEVVLAGGAGFGVPGVAGLTPDVDVDGDGLERIELDETNHVALCVDGDGAVIDGADCWLDTRIADAVSLTVHFEGVPAHLVGVEGSQRSPTCAGAESVWGICSESDARECGPGDTRPCEAEGCDAGRQSCAWGCDGWTPCQSVETITFGSCDDVRVQGAATCGGDPPVAFLVDGPEVSGAMRTPEDLIVGRGRISVEARVASSVGETTSLLTGWSLAAIRDPPSFEVEILGACP